MGFDAGLHALLQGDLAGHAVVEKRMFGGVAFMLRGHMVCAIGQDDAMYRVGTAAEAAARAIPGTAAVQMGSRRMAGWVSANAVLLADANRRGQLLQKALAHTLSLPPK